MQNTLCPFCMKPVQSECCPHCGQDIRYPGHANHLPVGFTLSGRNTYLFGAAIGQGGFGITYIALDLDTNQRVAIKEYFPTHCCGRSNMTSICSNLGQEETFAKGKQHFLQEAQMLQNLFDLDSVVKVLDYFEANNSAYLVMEYLDGLSLKDHVEKNGKLPAQQFLNQLKPLMADMEKMHQRGVVHRDIAPDNIILLPDGRLKLIDFGAARSYVGDKSMTVVVKKGFAPVEQYMRKGSNASTDVYALAATIYFCITGIIPPDSAERQYGEAELAAPTVLGVELSQSQERGLEKALEIQPKERTQTVSELTNALADISKPVAPKSIPRREQTTPLHAESKKKSKWWIPTAAALVVCLGAGVLFLGKDQPDAPVQTKPVQISTPETVPAATVNSDVVRYNKAVDLFNNGEYGKAAIAFHELGDFRDAKTISRQIWNALTPDKTIGAGVFHTVAVKNDGTVLTAGLGNAVSSSSNGHVKEWTDIISVTAGERHTVGLKEDGTVLATGLNTSGQCDVSHWTDIVDIVAGESFTAGLKSDGTVVLAGSIPNAEVIHTWDNIVSIAGERIFLAGLKADGSALFTDQPDLTKQNIIGLAVIGNGNSIIMKDDGSVTLHNGAIHKGDYVSVFGGGHITLAMQRNGTVMQEGPLDSDSEVSSLEEWDDLKEGNIVAFDASYAHAVILKKDGTASAYGDNKEGRCEVRSWKDIRLPKDRDALLGQIHLEYITDEGSPILPELETQPRVTEPSPADRYEMAVSAYESGNYEEARTLLEELGDYEDSGKYLRLIRIRNAGGNIGVGAAVYDPSLGLTDSEKADIDAAAEDFYFADTADVLLCNSDVAFYYLDGDWNGGSKCYIWFEMNSAGGSYRGIGSKLSTNYPKTVETNTISIINGELRLDVLHSNVKTLQLTLTGPDTMEVLTYEKGNNSYTLNR